MFLRLSTTFITNGTVGVQRGIQCVDLCGYAILAFQHDLNIRKKIERERERTREKKRENERENEEKQERTRTKKQEKERDENERMRE